ncbi:MAG: YfiR family protein [Gammaproteobacteria bacterium]|nr:YfiR family protein [Gammaproteobacteria bacterium]
MNFMHLNLRKKYQFSVIAIVLTLLFASLPQRADAISYQQKLLMLKALMTIKFFKYSRWPDKENNSSDSYNLCVLDTPELLTAFNSVKGKLINGKELKVNQVNYEQVNSSVCHLLYIGKNAPQQALKSLLENLIKEPILTISDQSGFAANGGMVELVTIDKKIAFNINLYKLRKSSLSISSSVLELADKVIKK